MLECRAPSHRVLKTARICLTVCPTLNFLLSCSLISWNGKLMFPAAPVLLQMSAPSGQSPEQAKAFPQNTPCCMALLARRIINAAIELQKELLKFPAGLLLPASLEVFGVLEVFFRAVAGHENNFQTFGQQILKVGR